VYLYFDNDAKVRAPVDAKKLVSRVNAILGKISERKGMNRAKVGRLARRTAPMRPWRMPR
jgi:hypothetical protein